MNNVTNLFMFFFLSTDEVIGFANTTLVQKINGESIKNTNIIKLN